MIANTTARRFVHRQGLAAGWLQFESEVNTPGHVIGITHRGNIVIIRKFTFEDEYERAWLDVCDNVSMLEIEARDYSDGTWDRTIPVKPPGRRGGKHYQRRR